MNSKIMFSIFLGILFTVGLVSATCCNIDYDSMSVTAPKLVKGYGYEDSLGVKVGFGYKTNSCNCVDYDSMRATPNWLVGGYTLPAYEATLVNQEMPCCGTVVVKQVVPKAHSIGCY